MSAAWSTVVAAAEGVDTGAPPIVWGVATLLIFMILLAITLSFGKGRG